ncbi:hypothetical protein ANO14919_126420 [Xylariales sp. No.14919]|nr:hypothetical protein ANO14919_126420 [Xylariales sp. No.14919]
MPLTTSLPNPVWDNDAQLDTCLYPDAEFVAYFALKADEKYKERDIYLGS